VGSRSHNFNELYKALIRSRMEHRAFLFHKLKKKQLQKLEKIQDRGNTQSIGLPE
jgi:hypothetical protein